MYDAFSSDYDRFVNWPARLGVEMPFLLRNLAALKQPDRPEVRVLDAACGTGMHAIALAKAGYRTAGADLSQRMIERARQNAQSEGLEINFEPAGFGSLERTFSPGPHFPFDGLVCLGNSLPHLLTVPELQSALADFSACLRPNGMLIVQSRNFDAVLQNRERWMEPQSHREDDKEWLFLRFYDYLADGLIDFNIVTLFNSAMTPWTQRVTTTRLRPLLQSELGDALVSSGFAEVTYWGNMQGDPFNPRTSGNLIALARKS